MSDRDKYVHVSRLSGNILVSVFCISHISEPCSPEDLEKAEQALIAGEGLIVRQAMKYGKWPHFKNVFFGSGDDTRIQVHGFPTDRYMDSVQRRTELKVLSASTNWMTGIVTGISFRIFTAVHKE